LKPASSMSSSLKAAPVNKDLHKDSDVPRADAPFPKQKASTPASMPDSATMPSAMASSNSASTPGTYRVKKGDTLDKVVQKALGDSPLKSEILKREIVAMNPDALTKGNPKILKVGALLNLPNNDDLLRKQLGMGTSSSPGARRQFVGYETYPDVIINPQGMEKRKGWVQFP
jgi:Tfp pilus assembly protein FimV